jgi:outer membrane protein OmpA-like peptidoglycan-associated protein
MGLSQFRLVASLLMFGCIAASQSVQAQDFGYAEALGALSISCRQDIAKFCPKANLGGGQVAECLEHNWANVSSSCKSANSIARDLIVKRRNARRAVVANCELDRMRLCSGIQPGDANLMECFYKTKPNVSGACRQAIRDAGYEVSLATGPITNQIHLSSADILTSLEGAETLANIDAIQLRKMAAESMRDPRRASRVNRPPVFEHLNSQAQLTVAMQFDFNSARIIPSSYRAIGLIADALYHPHLQGYCFLVIGHTDAVGSREYNFKLSQERADAVRAALINPFGIDERRIAAVGLGEEQLMDAAHPESAENRRVQLINVGKLPGNPACEDKPPEEIK